MKKKLKTIKAAKKRIKKVKKEFIRKKAYKSHFLRKKNSANLRRLSLSASIHITDKKKFFLMLPYN